MIRNRSINFLLNKVIITFILLTFINCNSDDSESEIVLNEKWVLTKMTGSIPDSETTGSEMEWQEFYLFTSGNVVTKSREKDGVITEIKGTYKLTNYSNESLLEITYFEESDIIGSCSSQLTETLYFKPDNILYSTWNNCDGPGLIYKRID